jgi:hypothetical protein
MRRQFLRFLALCVVVVPAGCAHHADRLQGIRVSYYSGDLAAARAEIDRLLVEPEEDADVLRLDRAMIDLTAGRPGEAEQTLRQVRDRFDYFEQLDVREAALSMATDDNARAYAGEDHEKVLLLSFLALSNLMQDGGDAHAYALQIADKQQKLIERAGGLEKHPELAEAQVALGPYVQAVVTEQSRLNFDDVIRARTQVVSYQPEFRDGQSDLERAKFEVPTQPGNGALYVFALVGRGPTKEETLEVPTQAALLVADRILSAVGKHDLPPTVAPIRVPVVVERLNRITHVEIDLDGAPAGETATLVDVGRTARLHYEARYPEIVGRAVARRIVKKAAVFALKDSIEADRQPLVNFALNLAGIAWEATEAPDTRCWGLLPDSIQVLRVELPAGEHALSLQPADRHGPFGQRAAALLRIEEGRNTYVLANFPDGRLVGEVVVSGN